MRLFAIGDTHLPSTRNRDMDRFGWIGHPEPLRRAWDAAVRPGDVVIVAGDISWAMRPAEAADDLKWLDQRPGEKILLRGNHDFWWGDSATKLRKILEPFPSFHGFLHNSAVRAGPWIVAGSRLWTAPEAPELPGGEMGAEPVDLHHVEREAHRLQLSIDDALAQEKAAGRPLIRVVATHFPPLYANALPTAFTRVIEGFRPKLCVYGHLHAAGIAAGFLGEREGTQYRLVSCDAAGFAPVLVDEAD